MTRLLTVPFTTWSCTVAVSAVSDGILYFAIGWTAAGVGGGFAGLTLTLVVLPRAVLLLAGGVAGDRWGARRLLIGCDLILLGTLGAYHGAGIPLCGTECALAGLAVTVGVVSAFRLPAAGSVPRLLCPDPVVPRAMAMVSGVGQTGRMVGTALGGVLVAATGMTGAVLTVGTAVLAVVVALTTLVPLANRAVVPETAPPRVRDGLRAARRIPGVLTVLCSVGLTAGALLPMMSLCIPLAARERTWTALETGVVEATWVLGALVVTMTVLKRGTAHRPVLSLTSGPLLASVGVLVIAAADRSEPAVAGAFVMGIGTATFTSHAAARHGGAVPVDVGCGAVGADAGVEPGARCTLRNGGGHHLHGVGRRDQRVRRTGAAHERGVAISREALDFERRGGVSLLRCQRRKHHRTGTSARSVSTPTSAGSGTPWSPRLPPRWPR